MTLELGSLAEWIGGIGGFLAAGAAVVAWRVNQRMLKVEERRDREAESRRQTEERLKAAEQAGLVFVLGAMLPDRNYDERWALFLFNGSSKPVFDVCVESQRLNGDAQNHPLNIGALPPGQFVVPSDPKYHWGTLSDLSLSPEKVDLLVKGKGRKMIVSVSFRDANGQHWTLAEGTDLLPHSESSVV